MERSVLEGKAIVCFSQDWEGDPTSKKHIMRLLAEKNTVLWVNSIGHRTPQLLASANVAARPGPRMLVVLRDRRKDPGRRIDKGDGRQRPRLGILQK